MTRDEIKNKVLSVIDEVGGVDSTNIINEYPIDILLDQAGRELIMIAPVATLENTLDLDPELVIGNEDGAGVVILPDDFTRLVSLKMKGWCRAVHNTIAATSNKYAEQFHRTTRGGIANPVVALLSDRLEYFSLELGMEHELEEGKYISYSEVDEFYPQKLLNTLVWLTASMCLKTMSEYDAAKVTIEEYDRMLNNLFLSYGN